MIENFLILQNEALSDFWYIHGVIERSQGQNLGILLRESRGEIKNWVVNVIKHGHQATQKQKTK